jgi:uncharacterized protein YjbI with pentapeptide repeats
MDDEQAGGEEGATVDTADKKLKDLFDAVVASTATARTNWLSFIALLVYLATATGGISHKDLLLDAPVKFPIVGMELPLSRFIMIAPLVLLSLMTMIIMQQAGLAWQCQLLDRKLQSIETQGRRDHPLRQQLPVYFLTQNIAGTRNDRFLRAIDRLVLWLSFFALPVSVLLLIQIIYLPFHSDGMTLWHNACVTSGIAVYIFFRSRLDGIEHSARVALRPLRRMLAKSWVRLISATRRAPVALSMATILTIVYSFRPVVANWTERRLTNVVAAIVLLFSWLVATVPDSLTDRVLANSWFAVPLQASTPYTFTASTPLRHAFFLSAHLFEQPVDYVTGQPQRYLSRNLVVTDTTLSIVGLSKESAPPIIAGVPFSAGADTSRAVVGPSLRGRDLRYATLDRSVMPDADFTGANLFSARFFGANLRRAKFGCAHRGGPTQPLGGHHPKAAARLAPPTSYSGSSLRDGCANLAMATLWLADLRYADLRSADLRDVDLDGSDLRHAILNYADLRDAYLRGAKLHGATFDSADLTGADLQGIKGVAVSFKNAQLSLANISKASLYLTDFEGARMEAVLADHASVLYSNLDGATMPGIIARSANVSIWPGPSDTTNGVFAGLKIVEFPPKDHAILSAIRSELDLYDRSVESSVSAVSNVSRVQIDKSVIACLTGTSSACATMGELLDENRNSWKVATDVPVPFEVHDGDEAEVLLRHACKDVTFGHAYLRLMLRESFRDSADSEIRYQRPSLVSQSVRAKLWGKVDSPWRKLPPLEVDHSEIPRFYRGSAVRLLTRLKRSACRPDDPKMARWQDSPRGRQARIDLEAAVEYMLCRYGQLHRSEGRLLPLNDCKYPGLWSF